MRGVSEDRPISEFVNVYRSEDHAAIAMQREMEGGSRKKSTNDMLREKVKALARELGVDGFRYPQEHVCKLLFYSFIFLIFL